MIKIKTIITCILYLIFWAELCYPASPIQGIIARKAASGCSASYGAELDVTENGSAPTGVTEANATTGWTNVSCATFDAAGTPYLGTYALQGIADANNDAYYFDLSALSLSASTVYQISLYTRHNGTGGTWRLNTGVASGVGMSGITYSIANSAPNDYTNKKDYILYNEQQRYITAREYSGTNDGGIYIDALSVKAATLCYGSELHTSANASSLTNEANATTGWTAINSLNSLTSDASIVADGTYSIKSDATIGPTAGNGFNIDLAGLGCIDGHKYFILFKTRHIGSGDAWVLGFESTGTGIIDAIGLPPFIGITSAMQTYVEYGWAMTYSSAIRYFVAHENGTNNNGGIYIDSFSVKEITGE